MPEMATTRLAWDQITARLLSSNESIAGQVEARQSSVTRSGWSKEQKYLPPCNPSIAHIGKEAGILEIALPPTFGRAPARMKSLIQPHPV
jgi:hypothetical protein